MAPKRSQVSSPRMEVGCNAHSRARCGALPRGGVRARFADQRWRVLVPDQGAFADDAFLVSGTIRFTCLGGGWDSNPAAASVADALAGSDLSHCVNNDTEKGSSRPCSRTTGSSMT